MWDRIMGTIDKLITLLKSEPFDTSGQSLWDRTLIYVATDFGRTRNRPDSAVQFGSGHDLKQRILLLSPMVKKHHSGRNRSSNDTDVWLRCAHWNRPARQTAEQRSRHVFRNLTAMGADLSGSGFAGCQRSSKPNVRLSSNP